MTPKLTLIFRSLGSISFIAGVIILASFLALASPSLPSLRGPFVSTFLAYFFITAVAYLVAVLRLPKDHLPIKLIWAFAILFRLILLFTEPTLSDDVFRYAWDGHLLNNGINPYAAPVESSLLDAFAIPLRASVNHAWMASPYLPTSQLIFALVDRLVPQSIKAFQVTAVIFDLLTGWLVFDLLRLLKKPMQNVLIYLWNPLVVIEFAHGAHIDALMIFLVMLTFWLLVKASDNLPQFSNLQEIGLLASVVSLALATLTKLLPILLAPILLRRWGWKRMLLFIGLILLVLSLFALNAGWGLTGLLDGTGVFGALRIYTTWWNFNGSLYHWLEVLISGYATPGAVPVDVVGEKPILISKLITAGLFGLVMLNAIWQSQRDKLNDLDLIRLGMLVLSAYLLFTPTVHPW